MTKYHSKVGQIIKLDSDESVAITITRAAAGHQSAAWLLIRQLEVALRGRHVSEALFDHAAGFFGQLLDIHNATHGRTAPRDLAKAFDTLHLVHRRGQPKREVDEKLMLAARVVLLRLAGFSADKALGVLEACGNHPRTAYWTAYREYGEQLDRFSGVAELEVMAETSCSDMLHGLLDAGSITRTEFQHAQTRLERARR